MKTILNQSKILLVGLFVTGSLISCEPRAIHSVLPEFKGEIKLDRTKIGKDQKLSASYVIPTGGQNIEPNKMYWNWGDGHQIDGKMIEKDGSSIISFVAPEVGEQTISFVGRYINLEKSEYETKSISKKFTVVECDVFTSFWDDSRAVVMATANEIFETETDTDVLIAFVKNSLTQANDAAHQYYFNNDKLNKVVNILFSGARAGAAVGYTNSRLLALEREGYTRTSFDVVNISTGVKEPIDMTKLKDVTYTAPISTGVENGELELMAKANSDKTNVIMSYKMQDIGLVIDIITYEPRR